MNDLVGIIRKRAEIEDALDPARGAQGAGQARQRRRHRQFNPGWHLALDLRNMLLVSECVARAALMRQESRGGHTRDDYPAMDPSGAAEPGLLGTRPTAASTSSSSRCRRCGRTCSNCSRGRAEEVPDPEELPTARRGIAPEGPVMSYDAHFRVWRGDADGGDLVDYTVEVNEGEVVLDIIHRLQATQAGDLAVRWNCKAGKCGSCSAEINGKPRLLCMTRMSTFTAEETITVTPLRAFPVIRDLVTDVSFNYTKAREVPAFAPPAGLAPGEYRMQQVDVERSQEFRKCIECFLCQDICHVVRDHEENKQAFAGPRFLMRVAELDMHPLDPGDRPTRPGRARPRLLQHHQVLHRGLPRAHQDHRQRADPAQGARRRPQVRPARVLGRKLLRKKP